MRSSVPGLLELASQKDLSADVPSIRHTGEFGITPITAGHVIRDDGTQIERYYVRGRWLLFAATLSPTCPLTLAAVMRK